jgi:Ca2+-binding RTX toxin-like protein
VVFGGAGNDAVLGADRDDYLPATPATTLAGGIGNDTLFRLRQRLPAGRRRRRYAARCNRSRQPGWQVCHNEGWLPVASAEVSMTAHVARPALGA